MLRSLGSAADHADAHAFTRARDPRAGPARGAVASEAPARRVLGERSGDSRVSGVNRQAGLETLRRPGGLPHYYAGIGCGAGCLCLHSWFGHCHTGPALSHFSTM